MFYIKEISFRSQYFLLSLFLTTIVCYLNKNALLFLLTFTVMSSNIGSKLLGVEYFIYTHPSELFTTYIFLTIYFSALIVFSQFWWHILDFLRSSLTFSDYFYLLKICVFVTFCVFLFNLVCFLTLFPNFWFFFEAFNSCENDSVNLFLELRVTDYFSFLNNFLYIINICFFFLLFVCFIISYSGLKTLLHWKKLFIFLNIVFATLLSPPDVSSQLLIFLVLTLLFETIVIIYLYYFKICKYIQLINKASY